MARGTTTRRGGDAWWLLLALVGGLLLLVLAYVLPRSASLSAAWPAAALPQRGFNAPERMGADEQGLPFRWSTGEATLLLPNGGGSLLLTLLVAAPPEGREAPLELATATRQFPALPTTASLRFYRLLLGPDSWGERVPLTIETDSFREDLGRRKERRLGLMIATVGVAAPGGWPPATLLLALALACTAVYPLLRHAGWHPRGAALTLLVAQGVLALLQGAWLWQWGLSGRLLLGLALAATGALAVDRFFARGTSFSPERTIAPLAAAQGWGRALVACLLLAMIVRLPWLAAPDPVGDLELSARRTATLAAQGLAGAYGGSGGGDYLPLRLYLLWGLGSLAAWLAIPLATPLTPAASLLLKLPWLLADLATVAVIFCYATRRQSPRHGLLIACLYAAMPQVWLNAAWWGQVDALLVLLLVLALLSLRQPPLAWSLLALALLVKVQAVILLPLIALLTLRRYGTQGLVRGVAAGGLVAVLGLLPLMLAGQTPWMLEAYIGSVGRFNSITINAWNIWYLVAMKEYVPDTNSWLGGLPYRQAGLLLLGGATLLIGLLAARRDDAALDPLAAALQALAFFLLPTQIHERYLFLCFAFLSLTLATLPRLWLPFVLLSLSATLNIFASLDFWPALRPTLANPSLGYLFVALNLALFGWLLAVLAGSRRLAR